jgi:hypothetical protein
MSIDKLVELNLELVGWLSTQRGAIPKDYAKELSKILTVIEREQERGELTWTKTSTNSGLPTLKK